MKTGISFNGKPWKKNSIKKGYKCDDASSAHTEQFKCQQNKILLTIIYNVTDSGRLLPETQTKQQTKHI